MSRWKLGAIVAMAMCGAAVIACSVGYVACMVQGSCDDSRYPRLRYADSGSAMCCAYLQNGTFCDTVTSLECAAKADWALAIYISSIVTIAVALICNCLLAIKGIKT